jgi:antitoxin component HigA of HigAB toxin-antitoxin module
MGKQIIVEDARDLILEHLKKYGIKQRWLAEKLDLSDSHLTLVLQKERDLTEENLNKINEALQTDFKLTA